MLIDRPKLSHSECIDWSYPYACPRTQYVSKSGRFFQGKQRHLVKKSIRWYATNSSRSRGSSWCLRGRFLTDFIVIYTPISFYQDLFEAESLLYFFVIPHLRPLALFKQKRQTTPLLRQFTTYRRSSDKRDEARTSTLLGRGWYKQWDSLWSTGVVCLMLEWKRMSALYFHI